MHKYIIGFLFLVASVGASDLSAKELDTLLSKLEKNLSGIEQLHARFDQTKHISFFDEAIEAKGQLLFKAPHAIRFEILEPFQSVLIVNDKKVGKYEKTGKGWQKLRLHNPDSLALVMNQIADWMQGKFREQSRVFKISAEKKEDTQSIVLTPIPKGFAKLIARIEIVLKPDINGFSSITIREPGGDYTVLNFTSDLRNSELADELFDPSADAPTLHDTDQAEAAE